MGAPVTATDPGFDGRQETLTYVLSGADGSNFDIDSGTGQIRVKAALNYEDTGRRTHSVTVTGYGPVRRSLTAEIEGDYHGYGRGRSPDDHGGKHLGRL